MYIGSESGLAELDAHYRHLVNLLDGGQLSAANLTISNSALTVQLSKAASGR
jgi:hypothetical protein